jgi:diaminopimelate decarboxylase
VGEGILIRVAAEVGTPVYVYDAEKIRSQHAALGAALAGIPHRLHYSVKANANLSVLSMIRGLGGGADIVSGGELARALRAGFLGRDLVFSGVGKARWELEAALNAGVGLINLESQGEFEVVRGLARGRAAPVVVGLRVNPDVTTETHPYTRTGQAGMKFGVPLDQVVALARCVADEPSLVLASVGMHIGSQIADGAPYRLGAERLSGVVAELRAAGITTLTSVDVGGGLGISYGRGDGMDPAEFAAAVAPLAGATGLPLLMEPGRFLVGNAGYLLTRVLYQKRSGGREFLITDAGMNDLLRPSLYQAYHDIVVIDGAGGSTASVGPVDVVGPNCESGDFLALDRRLDGAGPGALLAVLGAGAYGFGMSFQYNSRPRSAEVLVDGGRYAVVREREGTDDLMRGETAIPAWRDA